MMTTLLHGTQRREAVRRARWRRPGRYRDRAGAEPRVREWVVGWAVGRGRRRGRRCGATGCCGVDVRRGSAVCARDLRARGDRLARASIPRPDRHTREVPRMRVLWRAGAQQRAWRERRRETGGTGRVRKPRRGRACKHHAFPAQWAASTGLSSTFDLKRACLAHMRRAIRGPSGCQPCCRRACVRAPRPARPLPRPAPLYPTRRGAIARRPSLHVCATRVARDLLSAGSLAPPRLVPWHFLSSPVGGTVTETMLAVCPRLGVLGRRVPPARDVPPHAMGSPGGGQGRQGRGLAGGEGGPIERPRRRGKGEAWGREAHGVALTLDAK